MSKILQNLEHMSTKEFTQRNQFRLHSPLQRSSRSEETGQTFGCELTEFAQRFAIIDKELSQDLRDRKNTLPMRQRIRQNSDTARINGNIGTSTACNPALPFSLMCFLMSLKLQYFLKIQPCQRSPLFGLSFPNSQSYQYGYLRWLLKGHKQK